MRLLPPFLTLAMLLFQACQPVENAEAAPVKTEIDSSAIQFLLYPQQGLLELWTAWPASPNQRLDSFPLQTAIDFPIGIYSVLSEENGPVLSYPNAFYQEKLGKKAQKQQLSFAEWREKYPRFKAWEGKSAGKRVLVMAEEACFACPHWMAEVYSLLDAAR